jgi:outer membrane protein assembly factor BamE (lipoprotein component of BamABCDE complex)
MKNILILLSTILFISCSQIDKRGYSFELSDYEILKETFNNQNDVLSAMGYPILTEYSNKKETWIYYSEDVKKLFFLKPKVLNRQIITISFDNNQKIKEIRNYSLKDQNQIKLNSNYTKVNSPQSEWWKQIFGNIGQVRAN